MKLSLKTSKPCCFDFLFFPKQNIACIDVLKAHIVVKNNHRVILRHKELVTNNHKWTQYLFLFCLVLLKHLK